MAHYHLGTFCVVVITKVLRLVSGIRSYIIKINNANEYINIFLDTLKTRNALRNANDKKWRPIKRITNDNLIPNLISNFPNSNNKKIPLQKLF